MYKLEAIYWKDHWTRATGWVEPSEINMDEYKVGLVMTIGFVIVETDEFIVVSNILDTEDGAHRLENLILKNCITKRTPVELTA